MAKNTQEPTPQGCWILTNEVNEYDQHGEYFCAVWCEKPTIGQLTAYFQTSESEDIHGSVMDALAFVLHVHNGGGRRKVEHEWWNLRFEAFQ